MGWDPAEFDLKDHSVFQYDGYYYLASIYLPGERKFAYARSQDLCNWEDLGPILTERTPGAWDAMAIWAPFVLEVEGTFYMYYTGVISGFTQSIMLATSTNPADPASWEEQGMIFQPTHFGADWTVGEWANCRDPHVLFANGNYYLFYTGTDVIGGIVGAARSAHPAGPWTDLGSVVVPAVGINFESPTAFFREGTYYLTYHQLFYGASEGTFTLINTTPDGLYTEPISLKPGWAHEFWQGTDQQWYTSYLTSYKVTISPLQWQPSLHPARPFIGENLYQVFLPALVVD
jgi:beta-xylosidase